MKLKVVLVIIGAAIVTAGIICLLNWDKTTDELGLESDRTGDQKDVKGIIKYKSDFNEFSNLNDVKMEAAEKISERHEEAKKMVKDSVDRIFGDSEITATKNEDAKKKIFNELDNI